MSPRSLRRYRAERLLRQDFAGLRAGVIASVRGRLRASGVILDASDLEACYAQAWQGLYVAVLDGQEIAAPTAWLALVTFRRAIEEHRARTRSGCVGDRRERAGEQGDAGAARSRPWSERVCVGNGAPEERDLAAELDDRVRLRELFEALRGRLSTRERQAATLCYLQGLSRAEAAARMGVSEARMRKLMEGQGVDRPGVAGKVGALVDTIGNGDWCQEQGSLMRALAYGILDPEGERYRLAQLHRSECPACRAYVVSLRGLAVVLPPVLLPGTAGAELLARAVEAAHGGGSTGGASASAGATGGGIGGALSATGTAGAGGAAGGGGWLFAGGSLGAKLAVGCLLALGVGAGCAALGGEPAPHASAHGRRHAASRALVRIAATDGSNGSLAAAVPSSGSTLGAPSSAVAPRLAPAARASREFGPEQASAGESANSSVPGIGRAPSAQSASSSVRAPLASAYPPASISAPSSSADERAAQREFSPG